MNLPIRLAVKLIDPARSHSAELRERFKREAHAAAQLRSTHIVQITDYGVEGELPYIVMELLEGESLAARLARKGRLSSGETGHILSQVAKALELAHGHGIVHRDLKPENVFIQGYRSGPHARPDQEQVKVLDFGVAKILVPKPWRDGIRTRTGEFLGTPVYMSPEQIRDSSNVDRRTDIWSFGVMAYECMSGRRPFQGKNLVDLQFSICHDDVIPPSQVADVPECFDTWFARAVCRDLSGRFATIDAAMDQLRQALDGGALQRDEGQQSVPVDGVEETLMVTTQVDDTQCEPSAALDDERSPATVRELAGLTTIESLRRARAREFRRRILTLIVLLGGLGAVERMRSLTHGMDPTVPPRPTSAQPAAPSASAMSLYEPTPCFVPYDSIPIVAASALPLETTLPRPVAGRAAGTSSISRSTADAARNLRSQPAPDPSAMHNAEAEPDYGLY